MENGLISVDRWGKGSSAYFLTHLHSDHTHGLSSSWSNGPLFCSRLTAKLLPFKFPNFNLSLLRILEIGSWHTLSPSSSFPTTLHVFVIDACHCPGSIMLVFRGEFGCRICTGDFRWEPDCEKARMSKEMLVAALKDDVVDVAYIDNTYSNPIYDFPTRQLAANQVHSRIPDYKCTPLEDSLNPRYVIIDIISSHPDHDIIIGINTLGKEDLLLQISRALKIKVSLFHNILSRIIYNSSYHGQ
ncbi:putative metallo-beta-lactamase [Lupinus albus]|uniref:Putative metallo-beta-lactamase n=1 Tax=Lupinus albus TaxID=3870 RepID=A0A6A4QVC1_LUPAL|nr:putative metallo-beta-lactamase [Lupinus albus]